jgi:hypothetical protein
MFCPKCGKKLKDTAKFCTGCGTKINVPQIEFQEGMKDTDKDMMSETVSPSKKTVVENASENNKNKSYKKIIFIISVVLVAAIVGVVEFKLLNKDDVDKGVGTSHETTDSTDVSTDNSATDNNDVDNDDSDENEVVLPYCNNDFCDIQNNLTRDDFVRVVSPDNTYSFSYPKYLFNNAYYSDENGYYFSYDEDGQTVISMRVYTEDCAGDPIEIATDLQNEMKEDLYKVAYVFPKDIEEHGVGDDGIMQVVVSGWENYDYTQARYSCKGNDGNRTYCLEISYPDYDKSDEQEYFDYIVDCAYRMTSFCGSSKEAFADYSTFKSYYSN